MEREQGRKRRLVQGEQQRDKNKGLGQEQKEKNRKRETGTGRDGQAYRKCKQGLG